MAMAGNPFMYPPMVAPYARGFGQFASMGGMGMYAASQRASDNLTTDAMMMLELAKRSRERSYAAQMTDKKFKALPSSP
jgi:hypothetical protein